MTSTAGPAPLVHTDRPAAPSYRRVAVRAIGGVDGLFRIVGLLRERRYRVRDMSVDVREGVVESTVRCTVLLNGDDLGLLLHRLRRLPQVVLADED